MLILRSGQTGSSPGDLRLKCETIRLSNRTIINKISRSIESGTPHRRDTLKIQVTDPSKHCNPSPSVHSNFSLHNHDTSGSVNPIAHIGPSTTSAIHTKAKSMIIDTNHEEVDMRNLQTLDMRNVFSNEKRSSL